MRVFISHDPDEKALAEPFANWLEEKIPGVEVFCSSRPGEITAAQWRDEVMERAREDGLVICLLSPESLHNPWIQFEAGLASSGKNPGIVPAIYGGLTPDDVPSTLRPWQILNLTNREEFTASMKTISDKFFGEGYSLNFDSLYNDHNSTVRRMIDYGPLASWVEGGIITNTAAGFELTPANDRMDFPMARKNQVIVSIRVALRPLPRGHVNHWKCGLAIRNKNDKDNYRGAFQFHSTCYQDQMWFTLYAYRPDVDNMPINIPADLRLDQKHIIQMWFSPDLSEVQAVGIDNSNKYCKLTKDGRDPIWLPDRIDECDSIRLQAWADNDRDGRPVPFRVRIEKVETDYKEMS